MGCGPSKVSSDGALKFAKKSEEQALADCTHFSLEEIHALKSLFQQLSNTIVKDNHIHREELALALFQQHRRKSLFVDCMFTNFDTAENNVISFGEFVQGISVFHPLAPLHEKADFAFNLYDLGKTGSINKTELKNLLVDVLADNPGLRLTDEQIDRVIEQTFSEADQAGDGVIHRSEFHNLVEGMPGVIDWMTLPILRELTTKYPSFMLSSQK